MKDPESVRKIPSQYCHGNGDDGHRSIRQEVIQETVGIEEMLGEFVEPGGLTQSQSETFERLDFSLVS